MEITIKTDELYSLIKKAVREVLHEESLEFFMKNVPLVSKEEMEDIENLYGKPSPNKEVVFSETIEV
jgi:hypothetical protein